MRVRAALPGAGVPDTEALRRAALLASWARDRRVGRRRLMWRWLLWLLLRFGLPVLALASVLVFAWLLMQHRQADRSVGPAGASAASAASQPGAAAQIAVDVPVTAAPALRLDLNITADAPDPPVDSLARPSIPASTPLQPSNSGDSRP